MDDSEPGESDGASGGDCYVPRRKRHKSKRKTKSLEFNTGKNEVDHMVFNYFVEYFEIRKTRVESTNCSKSLLNYLRQLVGYGFEKALKPIGPTLLPGCRWYRYLCNNISVLPNIIKLLLKISNMEDAFGVELWDQTFFNMPILTNDKNLDFMFRASIVNSYMNCIFAEEKKDWISVATSIGSLEVEKIMGGRKYKLRPHSPYLPLLFLCGMQRNLALMLPNDLLSATIDTSVSAFKSISFGLRDLLRNPTAFFELNSFIFKVANGITNEAFVQGTSLKQGGAFRFTNNEYNRVLEWVHLANQFEKYKGERTEDMSHSLLDLYVFQFECSVVNFWSEALILLPGVLELMADLDEFEFLQKLYSICCSDVSLYPTLSRILEKRGLEDIRQKVFGEIIKENAMEISRYDETVDLLLCRSVQPDKYGQRDAILDENMPAIFGVLDLGRNRKSLEAWKALYEILRRVESRPEVVKPFYERRKSWWHQFHSVEVTIECSKIRKKCFKRLRKCI